LDASREASWHGSANALSRNHMPWPDIDSVHRATHKPDTPEQPLPETLSLRPPPPADPALDLSFAEIARQRRSAVDFDGTTRISAAGLFAMLDCLMVRRDAPPWNALPHPILVHPALMVHCVLGLDPGLYMFLRDPAGLPGL